MFIVGVNDGVIPFPHAEPGSDDETQEHRLLRVATSRGRDTLTITSHRRPSGFAVG